MVLSASNAEVYAQASLNPRHGLPIDWSSEERRLLTSRKGNCSDPADASTANIIHSFPQSYDVLRSVVSRADAKGSAFPPPLWCRDRWEAPGRERSRCTTFSPVRR